MRYSSMNKDETLLKYRNNRESFSPSQESPKEISNFMKNSPNLHKLLSPRLPSVTKLTEIKNKKVKYCKKYLQYTHGKRLSCIHKQRRLNYSESQNSSFDKSEYGTYSILERNISQYFQSSFEKSYESQLKMANLGKGNRLNYKRNKGRRSLSGRKSYDILDIVRLNNEVNL